MAMIFSRLVSYITKNQAIHFVRMKWRQLFLFSMGLCLVLLGSVTACKDQSSQAPSYHGINISGANYGRDFALQDAQGKLRSLKDFKGNYVLMFFGFTQCPDICPTSLSRAADVKQKLGDAGENLQVVFITIDPERDTGLLLEQYTQAFDKSFIGLRGDFAQTQAVADEFKAFYQKVPTGSSYTMDHSTFNYLFDTKGKLRLILRHESSADEFAADLRTLMQNERG